MKEKNSFFKKMLKSIYDMDAFSEYAKEGVMKSILYGILISLLLGGIQGIVSGYTFYKQVEEVNYDLREYKDDIFIQDGILNISKSPIKIEQDSGEIIYIDSEKTINDEKQISALENGFSINLFALKDGIIIDTPIDKYKVTYNNLFDEKFLDGDNLLDLIMNTEVAFIISSLISTIVGTIFDLFFNCLIVVTIASFISIFMKMVVRYKALWSLTIYASTLPLIVVTILELINKDVNFDTTFVAGALTYVVLILRYIKGELIKKMNMKSF